MIQQDTFKTMYCFSIIQEVIFEKLPQSLPNTDYIKSMYSICMCTHAGAHGACVKEVRGQQSASSSRFTPLFSEQGTETGAYSKLTPLGGQGAPRILRSRSPSTKLQVHSATPSLFT